MESQWTLSPVPASQPCRLAQARLGRLRTAWAAWCQAVLARRARRQATTALSELDEHVLRDIGAPDWLLRETEALRQMEQDRRAYWLRT